MKSRQRGWVMGCALRAGSLRSAFVICNFRLVTVSDLCLVTGAPREARDGLTRQLMQITTDAARDVRDFYPQNRVPAPAVGPGGEAGPRDLLVLSIGATGVNMINSGLCESPPIRDDGPQPPSATTTPSPGPAPQRPG
jgi:hypothetical protein